MRNWGTLLFSAALAAVVAWAVAGHLSRGDTTAPETAYQRILRTGTIRCGYFLFEPMARKGADGRLSGIDVRLFNKMAENMRLKVNWAEEVNFADSIAGLETGRYDALCTPTWPTAARAREVTFIAPQFYAGLGIWVRQDDHRFDDDWNKINSPDVTISGIDGQIEREIHDQTFPRAKMLELPAMTDYSLSLLNVANGKADVTFVDYIAGFLFNRSHPDHPLRNIAATRPFRVFPFTIAVRSSETQLANWLNTASRELVNSGVVQQVVPEELKAHGFPADALLLPASPYTPPPAK
jgi:polar amino acid transport system substrate-binding protein